MSLYLMLFYPVTCNTRIEPFSMLVVHRKTAVQLPACRGGSDWADVPAIVRLDNVQACHENTFIGEKMPLSGQYRCPSVSIMQGGAQSDSLNNANICSLRPHLSIYETCPKMHLWPDIFSKEWDAPVPSLADFWRLSGQFAYLQSEFHL